LIIKLGALGDVLRTTTILPALRRKYPFGRITWVTREESRELLQHNPYIDDILIVSQVEGLVQLLAQEFELAINLDIDPYSSALLRLCSARQKLGYILDPQGGIRPASPEAEEWFLMSIDDEVKKANTKTYQEHIFHICRLPYELERPILPLTDEIRDYSHRIRHRYCLSDQDCIIAIHTGAGDRWQNKKWTLEGFVGLIERLLRDSERIKVVLLGSNLDQSRNRMIEDCFPHRVYNINTDGRLRELIGLINISQLLVSGDTLPMHIATALGIPAVVIFGPTSAQEIELYGRGYKIVPPLDCICCYRSSCDRQPNCMQLVDPEVVYKGVRSLLQDTLPLGDK